MISRQQIEDAYGRIAPHIRKTPVIVVDGAEFGTQGPLALKLELLQHSSSFKARGAFMNLLTRDVPAAGVVAASGTTSATAMVSCCAHYLVTLAPVIGATGLVTLVAQYQVELFWAGLAFNAAGIIYIWRQLAVAVKEQTQCVSPA